MISVIIINKKGILNEKKVKNINEENLYKKCNLKNNNNFNCHIKYNSTKGKIQLWGKDKDRESLKNIYEFPNKVIQLYGNILVVNKNKDEFINITIDEFLNIMKRENLNNIIEDIEEEDIEDDEEDDSEKDDDSEKENDSEKDNDSENEDESENDDDSEKEDFIDVDLTDCDLTDDELEQDNNYMYNIINKINKNIKHKNKEDKYIDDEIEIDSISSQLQEEEYI